MSSHAARDRAEEESYDWILAMDPLTGQPQLAARPDFLEEAQVGAIAAAEAYNDDDSGRDEWFLEGDPAWEKFVDAGGRPWWWRERDGLCFYEPAGGAALAAAASRAAPDGWGQPGGPSEPNVPALTGGVCARPGCGCAHKRGQRRHGFCCNACRHGEPYHTVSCSGQGRMVCLAGAAAAAATLEVLPAGPPRQLDRRQRANHRQMVRLPVAWKRNTDEPPLAYVLWFMHRYGLQLEPGAQAFWERVLQVVDGLQTSGVAAIRL